MKKIKNIFSDFKKICQNENIKLLYNILIASSIIFFIFFLINLSTIIESNVKKIQNSIDYYLVKYDFNTALRFLKDKNNLIGVIKNDKLILFDGWGNPRPAIPIENESLLHLEKNYYIFNDSFLAIKKTIKNNKMSVYFLFNFSSFFKSVFDLFINLIFTLIIYLIIIFIIFFRFFEKENQKKLFSIKNANENNAFHALVENLHHELSTPVSVLKLKLDKLNYQIQDIIKKYEKQKLCHITKQPCGVIDNVNNEIKTILNNKDIVENAFSQIESIIYNMKQFKHIKLSNGDKNLYDLFYGALKIVTTIKNIDAEIDIDEKLKKYKLNHEYSLSNGDLINILVNLIKNSFEANANKIEVKILKEIAESSNNYKLEIAFIDNGNGINPKIIKDIFQPNQSTKKDFNNARGNGLYISKIILNNANADIRLLNTSNKGTTFLLILNAKKI